MENNNNNRRKRGISSEDEVDQLLQSAQDELLLKLSIDSHMSRVSADYLPLDLDRRFQALKAPPSSASTTTSNKPRQAPLPVASGNGNEKNDDLLARFAALKASSSSSRNDVVDLGGEANDHDDDDDVDEVEKIIRWAKDAARLDPSPPSDQDDD